MDVSAFGSCMHAPHSLCFQDFEDLSTCWLWTSPRMSPACPVGYLAKASASGCCFQSGQISPWFCLGARLETPGAKAPKARQRPGCVCADRVFWSVLMIWLAGRRLQAHELFRVEHKSARADSSKPILEIQHFLQEAASAWDLLGTHGRQPDHRIAVKLILPETSSNQMQNDRGNLHSIIGLQLHCPPRSIEPVRDWP